MRNFSVLIIVLFAFACETAEETRKELVRQFTNDVLSTPTYEHFRSQPYILSSDTILPEKRIKLINTRLEMMRSRLVECEEIEILNLEEYNQRMNLEIMEKGDPLGLSYFVLCKDEALLSIEILDNMIVAHERNLRTGQFLRYY